MSLTVLFHAQGHAALQPAVLAAVAVVLVDHALSGAPAGVHQVLPDAAFKEALTALAAHRTIMATWPCSAAACSTGSGCGGAC